MEWMIGSALAWLLMVILTVVWIVLPFAVFGIKRRLDKIIEVLNDISESEARRK